MSRVRVKKGGSNKRIAEFLYEIGTMRKLPRMHRQTLLSDDMTDNIATHSYRVAMIGWFLAKQENLDASKVVMMCLLHDMGEVRTGDHNWVHKKYVKIYDEEILKEQLGSLPFPEFALIAGEYHKRASREAVIAKDADLIDQVLLLKEYEWQGNKEARRWLIGKGKDKGKGCAQIRYLKTDAGKALAKTLFEMEPSAWWNNIWTSKNR
jgi:putative hydrolase of HD superfamily